MTPEEYIIIKDAHAKIKRSMNKLLQSFQKDLEGYMPPQEDLRKATSQDVVVGVIFYYPPEDSEDLGYWHIIKEVLCPFDNWKAYVADDGCRYGLYNAFVKKG